MNPKSAHSCTTKDSLQYTINENDDDDTDDDDDQDGNAQLGVPMRTIFLIMAITKSLCASLTDKHKFNNDGNVINSMQTTSSNCRPYRDHQHSNSKIISPLILISPD